MKKLLIFGLALVLTSCLGMKKKNVGVIKEKFVTFSREGTPKYFVVTDKDSYQVDSKTYAESDTGEVHMEPDFYWEH